MSWYTKMGIGVCAMLPMVASAQFFGNLNLLVTQLEILLTRLLPLTFSLALLAFFWGIAKYIFALGSEEKKVEGKQIMTWGVVAMFVLASIWGIVYFIQEALGVGSESLITTPTFEVN